MILFTSSFTLPANNITSSVQTMGAMNTNNVIWNKIVTVWNVKKMKDIADLSARYKEDCCLGTAPIGDGGPWQPLIEDKFSKTANIITGDSQQKKYLKEWMNAYFKLCDCILYFYLRRNSWPKMCRLQPWTLKRKKKYCPCCLHQENVSETPEYFATISPS